MTAIINNTPSRSTVDAALIGPVRFGEVVEVADDGEAQALIASGHFALATKTTIKAAEALAGDDTQEDS